ncbi:MAG: hypothetical protein ACREOM_08665 [Candidatus Dormibacteraceae bacterium]
MRSPGTVLLGVAIALVVLIAPSMALLSHLDQRSVLESPKT